MDGIIIVYKEAGWTSFDVVGKLRRILNMKKIGHTGTLDPDAEGVLVLCVGKGTKLVQALTEHDKEYECVLLFGQKTDTQDVSGQVLKTSDKLPTEDMAREAALSFIGGYDQIPPMYSAKKVNGKKLYELARAGETVAREPRHVEITSLSVTGVDLPRMTFSVSCSKGTYIRTLCEDIGEKAGCPACMEHLLRTRVGAYALKDAKKLSEIAALMEAGETAQFLIPPDEVKLS